LPFFPPDEQHNIPQAITTTTTTMSSVTMNDLYEVIGRLSVYVRQIEHENEDIRAQLSEKMDYITFLESRAKEQEKQIQELNEPIPEWYIPPVRDVTGGVQESPYVFGPPISNYSPQECRTPVRDHCGRDYTLPISSESSPREYVCGPPVRDHCGHTRNYQETLVMPLSSMPVRQSNADVLDEEVVMVTRPPQLERQSNCIRRPSTNP
jgi:hypothetical protein